MRAFDLGLQHQKVTEPDPGKLAAEYISNYLAARGGLTVGELAFRLNVDKRDLQRLVREESCGLRLMRSIAFHFGDDFIEYVWRPIIGDGPSRRQRELDNERAEIAARAERLARDRAECRRFRADGPVVPGLDDEPDREVDFQ